MVSTVTNMWSEKASDVYDWLPVVSDSTPQQIPGDDNKNSIAKHRSLIP